jgi:ABC-type multidrug transport system permease subunit
MRRILDIGHNDLRLFLKRKSAVVWLFLLPLVFVYIFGMANRGPGGAPGNRRPRVLIENSDANSLGGIFREELEQDVQVVKADDRKAAAAVIRIPADFTGRVLRRQQANVQLLKGESSDEADDAIVQLHLARAVMEFNGRLLKAAASANTPQWLTEDRVRAVASEPNPVSLDARFAGRKPVPSGFNFSVPANLLMYLMMNLLIFGGSTMAAERRNGVIKRFMVQPLMRVELVMGKIYGLMLLGVVQIVGFLALGKFAFGIHLGTNLPLVALILVVFAWVAGSLGVLFGSVLAAEDRVVGVCVLASLLMASLGGCWWPLEIAPPAAQAVALCTPTGWALQALNQLISFGNGFSAVIVPLGVLLTFGVAANLLAARFFTS